VATLPLEGGHLALDFVNTVGGLRVQPPSPAEELLDDYVDLTIWWARVGVISERQAASLRAAAKRDSRGAQRALQSAKELRDELVYPIFRAIADGEEPPRELLDRLRDQECRGLRDAQLGRGWSWPPPKELIDPLRPIVHAAVELLTGGPLDRIKTCGNCRWLFIDQSRNHSRRWCSMDDCGSRSKMRSYRARRATAGR
jgi:predicted RNA-binding Zn ribbon-like protein